MNRKSRDTSSGDGRKNKNHRFFIIAAAFVLLCATFLVTLGMTQYNGPTVSDEDRGLDVRSETVLGERGRIFDRNGVLLVGNSNLYDLIFEYGSMAYDTHGVNSALLRCVALLNSSGNADKRSKDYFPLTGSYPNMALSEDAKNADSNVGFYYNRFLVRNSLDADASVETVIKHFTDKYKLTQKKYSDVQVTELIRLRYDMERVGFGAYQEYVIATGFDPANSEQMSFVTQIKEQKIEGATVIRQRGRVYYNEGYASHILGTIGRITAENVQDYEDYPLDAMVGISGCELAFEEYLRGNDGKRISKYDKDGNLVEQYYDPAPIVGNDIYLTIDIKLQKAAEDSLAEEIERLEYSESGAATALDPETGEVLVIASYPTYEVSQFNRALNGTYAPGSTYKIGSALAALEQGHINSSSEYYCNHVYPHLGGPTCLGTHGYIDVSEAIRVSCNVFFYYVGHQMGLDKVTPYTKRLGLGVRTGIELGESVGTVASKGYCDKIETEWREFDDAAGAIGQSYHLYTPLQLSVYTSSVVNHGKRYEAHLLKTVKSRTGETVLDKTAKVADTVEFSDSTYNTLMSAMHSVVSTSSELSSYFSGIEQTVGGKTGTAETGKYDNALFSGFAPVDKPKIVASCVLEYGEAGSNAAKIVADIFEEYFNPTPDEEETPKDEVEEE